MWYNVATLYMIMQGARQRKLKDKERHDREKRIKTNKKRKNEAGE